MIGTQRRCKSTTCDCDQGRVIDGHRHGFTHGGICSQDGVVEIEVHRLEVRGIGISVGGIGRGQGFVGRRLRNIQEVGRIDGPSL